MAPIGLLLLTYRPLVLIWLCVNSLQDLHCESASVIVLEESTYPQDP